jgi:hypothetical protein
MPAVDQAFGQEFSKINRLQIFYTDRQYADFQLDG